MQLVTMLALKPGHIIQTFRVSPFLKVVKVAFGTNFLLTVNRILGYGVQFFFAGRE